MIRKKRKGPAIIDLTGPEGNAFSLLSVAYRSARQLGLNTEQVLSEMKSGDYEHLVTTFDRYFGDYYILER